MDYNRLINDTDNIVMILASALDSTNCGVTITDATKKDNPIVYANKSFKTLTGYSPDEILGKNCRFLQGSDRQEGELNVLREAIAVGAGCKVTLRNYRKDGSLFWNELDISPVRDAQGITTHFIGVQNDISQIVMLKQQRDDFIATLVHDLKNPIIGSNRIIQLLTQGSVNATAERGLLQLVQESNETMLRMISNTLDYYRCEAGPLRPILQVIDLSKLCKKVLAEFELHAAQKSISLHYEFDSSPKVMGDDNLLRRVLVNLIDNAIKFTQEGGRVSLKVESSEDIVVHIANTGKQLSSEQIDKLFERFVQTEEGRKHSNSNGLGLFFCQQIINAHGGTITCRSDTAETEFVFNLPQLISAQLDLPAAVKA